MAGGWARDGAVQDQIDDSVTDAVLLARARLAQFSAKGREGTTHCTDCGDEIPERRRQAMLGKGASGGQVVVVAIVERDRDRAARNRFTAHAEAHHHANRQSRRLDLPAFR